MRKLLTIGLAAAAAAMGRVIGRDAPTRIIMDDIPAAPPPSKFRARRPKIQLTRQYHPMTPTLKQHGERERLRRQRQIARGQLRVANGLVSL